jgi:fructosamine-3-kinase
MAESAFERVLGTAVARAQRLGSQHGVGHYRLELTDGRVAFGKAAGQAGTGSSGFAAEAAGLRWLAEAGEVPVPAVLGFDDGLLVLEWVSEGSAGAAAARRFGADLARLHASGAEHFGAPWTGVIAGLALPNDQADDWPSWYATHRLLPFARLAVEQGSLSTGDFTLMETVAGRITELAGRSGAEQPSRIHGDCWSGNVLWSGGRGWLIDPAAHGGHRETDLAMLALFGAPYLDQILAAYVEVAPLAEGWRERVPLHQLHPLLVHVCLFGVSYRMAALAAARAALRL